MPDSADLVREIARRGALAEEAATVSGRDRARLARGRKQAPLLPAQRSHQEQGSEQPRLASVDRHEIDDARLADLASIAVAAIEDRLRAGDDPRDAVQAVLRVVFGGGTGAEDVDRVPGGAGPAAAMSADPATIDRITIEALSILRSPRG